ncbi:MAG: DUF4340 domain-containing protein [Ruminococcaceae bacterium]|nr:DUF4340 domain-containing protein [Oscillospiraceae bacterium]
MKKNAKILIASAAGIAVLGAATLALVLTKPIDDTAGSNTSSGSEKISVLSYKTDDILSLTIKNETDEFTIDRLGSEKWGTDGIPQEYANNDAYGNTMGKAGVIDAKMKVEDDAEDLAKYGFNEPTATIAMTFKDNKFEPVNCVIGMKNLGENAWYFKTEDSNTVYLVSDSSLKFAFSEELDYVQLATLVDSFDSENDIVNRIRIERPDLANDLVLDKLEEETDKEFQSVYVSYAMSSHNNILADDEKDMDIVYGMFGISASDVAVVKPTEDDKKKYGFDDPACVVTMVANEEEVTKLYIGDALYTVETDEETGKETKYVSGYYGMVTGKDVIYVFLPDSLPWLTIKPEDILYRLFLTPYIYYVDDVTVKDTDGKEYEFKIIGDADESKIEYNGEVVNRAKFKDFYQYLLSAYAEEIYIEDLTPDNKFVAGFTYDYREDDEGEDKVEFYSSEQDRTCIIVVNGDVRYKVRQMYATRLLQNLEALLSGGEILDEF